MKRTDFCLHLRNSYRISHATVLGGCILLLAALCATACTTDNEEAALRAVPLTFSTSVDTQTRAATDLTTDNLTSVGVFACFTQGDFNAGTATPNFMYNQELKKEAAAWTYSPLKYWPNNENDKISFFAYAPRNAAGVTLCSNTNTGFPYLDYTVPTAEADQTDLLAATPLMNQSYSSNPTAPGSIKFTMKHALTKVSIYAKSSDLSAGKKVVNSLSVTAPKSGKLTYKADGFSWSASTDKSTYIATNTDVTIATATADETVLLGTFYLIPERTSSSLNITYTVTGSISDNVNLPTDKPVITGQAFPDTYDWLPGASIAYTINIARTGIEIVAESSSMEWTSGVTNEIKLYDPAQLKLGDYYYDDGSWSDGGLTGMNKTINTRIWKSPLPSPDLTNPEKGSARKCIGVVFAVEGDAVLNDLSDTKALVVAPKEEKYDQYYLSTSTTNANFSPPGGALSSNWYIADEKTLRWMAKGDGSTATYLREILDEHLILIEYGAKLQGTHWVFPDNRNGVNRYVMNLTNGSWTIVNYLHRAYFRGVLKVLK